MCAQPAYEPGTRRAPAGKPGRGSNSIRRMAVLFTDVVGSSTYFKSYGDLAGREMLRKHQELASGPVAEHGGAVVKVLGDSVMAYFTDPKEALKAAVRIQQRFARHNRGLDTRRRILVRIGLHYGDGIVEKGDIYGDVVNITAKFLPLVKGGEIFVSGQLQEQVRGLSWARFEKLKLKVSTEVLKTLAIYRVSWDDQADLGPSQTTVLMLKPAWNLAKEGFEGAWKRLLQRKAGLWPGTPGKHTTLKDGSLVLYLKEASEGPGVARNALRFLRENLGSDRMPFLPLQILIDKGQFKRAGKPALERLEPGLARAKPGEISLSRAAFDDMKAPAGLKVIAPGEGDEAGLIRLVPEDTPEKDGSCLFLYQHSMGHGDHEPCFYCGDRRHLPGDCPSKQLPDVTRGMERLGYLSLEQINEVFLESLNGACASDSEDLARQAFFELKNVFQLRFLRTLWASNARSWSKVEAGEDDGERGGMIWIGQDCIRVSNLGQAEAVLVNCLEKHPGDFHALCAMGFLQVERGDLPKAKRFFKHALENADTVPRQIFTRFLLGRVHELSGEQRHAEEHARKILFAEPLCHEALYLDIRYKLNKGHTTEAIRRLRKLVEDNRNDFIAFLIDPELADFSDKIHPELRDMLEKARAGADRLSKPAAEEIERMQRFLGADDGELKRALSYHGKVQELLDTGSYYGYLDIIYYGSVIVQIGQRSSEQARRKLLRESSRLKDRHERTERFVRAYPHGAFLGSLPDELALVEKGLEGVRQVIRSNALEKFRDALSRTRELAGVMDRLDQKVRRLENLRRWVRFTVGFSKKAVLMEAAIVVIAILLFPVVGHYLSFLIPSLSFSPENIWVYQKGVLIIGGVAGLFLAFLMSARELGEA